MNERNEPIASELTHDQTGKIGDHRLAPAALLATALLLIGGGCGGDGNPMGAGGAGNAGGAGPSNAGAGGTSAAGAGGGVGGTNLGGGPAEDASLFDGGSRGEDSSAATDSKLTDARTAIDGHTSPDGDPRVRDAAAVFDGNTGPGATDAGRAAPSSDPTTFGLNGASKCPGSGFAVCEDFETTAVGSLPAGWTREGTWVMAVTSSDRARGSNALQVQVGAVNNERGFLLKTRAQLGPLATKHFGRMFFKMTVPTRSFVHWDFFHGNGPFGGGTNDVRWGFTGTQTVTYLFNVQTSANGEFGTNAPNQLGFDRWTCAEWSLDSTVAGGGETRFWLDGIEIPVFHRTGTLAQIPVFDRFGVGWELFNSGTTPSIAFIDEVVFDAARIGCNN
jgi:hypothetical protein